MLLIFPDIASTRIPEIQKIHRLALTVLALAAGILGFGLGIREAHPDARRGRALAERWCSECHEVAPGAPARDPAAPDFPAIAAEPSATAYALRVFLRTPHETMPNLLLGRRDIDDLVSYILSLKQGH
jgi:cytochrome c